MDPSGGDGIVGTEAATPGQGLPWPLPPPGRSPSSPPWLDHGGGFASPKSADIQAAADQAAEEALQSALDGMQQGDAGDMSQGLGLLGTSPPPPSASAAEEAALAAADAHTQADGMQMVRGGAGVALPPLVLHFRQ